MVTQTKWREIPNEVVPQCEFSDPVKPTLAGVLNHHRVLTLEAYNCKKEIDRFHKYLDRAEK